MNKKHIGASVFEDIKQWEKDPAFKKTVKEHVEKVKGPVKRLYIKTSTPAEPL